MAKNPSGTAGDSAPQSPETALPPTVHRSNPGDIGRRVALRRRQLGLTREETARRAGMAPNFLEYLETHPVEIETGAVLRLAGALETSESALLGGGVNLAPGRAGASATPVLEVLSPQECWERLSGRGVGRVAFSTAQGPIVLPLNFQVVDKAVIYRTEHSSAAAAAIGRTVAFEVDQLDEALSAGWSVLVVGAAEQAHQPAGPDISPGGTGPTPWAGGHRDLWVRISPDSVTGRTIRV
jgi:transcriptional regulator with XRE-family HTH domain